MAERIAEKVAERIAARVAKTTVETPPPPMPMVTAPVKTVTETDAATPPSPMPATVSPAAPVAEQESDPFSLQNVARSVSKPRRKPGIEEEDPMWVTIPQAQLAEDTVAVEGLGMGIANVLGDIVGGVVSVSRRTPRNRSKQPVPAEKKTKLDGTRADHYGLASQALTVRMGGRIVHGVRGVFAGSGAIINGGKDLILGTAGCVAGTVGSLTDAVLCVGDSILAPGTAANKAGQGNAISRANEQRTA